MRDKGSDSRKIAKARLDRVLFRDRTEISRELLERLGSDLLSVVSNYMEFDIDRSDIHIYTPSPEEGPVLYLKIPILSFFRESKVN